MPKRRRRHLKGAAESQAQQAGNYLDPFKNAALKISELSFVPNTGVSESIQQ
jgi:hypothetical protein